MRRQTAAAALLVSGLLIPLPAHAAPTQATAACALSLGSVNAAGDHQIQAVTATSPPSTTTKDVIKTKVFAPGATRLHGTWTREPAVPEDLDLYGDVVLGSTMYEAGYQVGSQPSGTVSFSRVGSGWDKFTYFEESDYDEGAHPGAVAHTYNYGLRNDGTLFRWFEDGKGWHAAGSSAGFSSVKTLALISQTRTYDTFLANTKGGALYTIHIPISSPMKPVVKKVRTRSWQAADQLIAERCGRYGTLLLGIDKDTKSASLYAVGHANGTSTVINTLGKVTGTFDQPIYFRWGAAAFANPPLNGE
ncbi:hypothetical protein [Kribbella sp. NPDC055071]